MGKDKLLRQNKIVKQKIYKTAALFIEAQMTTAEPYWVFNSRPPFHLSL